MDFIDTERIFISGLSMATVAGVLYQTESSNVMKLARQLPCWDRKLIILHVYSFNMRTGIHSVQRMVQKMALFWAWYYSLEFH